MKISSLLNFSVTQYRKTDSKVSKPENVNFCGLNYQNEFKHLFNSKFFKNLVKEHPRCAYTGKKMISQSELCEILAKNDLNKKASIALKSLNPYKISLFPIESEVLDFLNIKSKKYKNSNIKEIFVKEYPNAKKNVSRIQIEILRNINKISKNTLSPSDYRKVQSIIDKSIKTISTDKLLPEDLFSKSKFIFDIKSADLNDKEFLKRIFSLIDKFPTQANSKDAFIVYWAQPYKIIEKDNGAVLKYPITSQDIGKRLLFPSLATDEHIYPRQFYKEGIDGDYKHKNDKFQVTILTSSFINNKKSNIPLDDFIKRFPNINIAENIQNHVNNLINIFFKWKDGCKRDYANILYDYIKILKVEFEKISDIVRIDIKKLNEVSKEELMKKSKHIENDSAKKIQNNIVENFQSRKVQIHNSRYSK